jgi:hypothetical protein
MLEANIPLVRLKPDTTHNMQPCVVIGTASHEFSELHYKLVIY